MAVFRLLHLSDLHIARRAEQLGVLGAPRAGLRTSLKSTFKLARATSHSPKLVDSVVDFALAQGDDLDGVLISGDLATTGSKADLGAARREIDRLKQGLPVFLIPGNHDRFDGGRYLPGGKEFDNHFGEFWTPGEPAQILRGSVLGSDGEQLALLGADFCLAARQDAQGRWGYLGQGRAYDRVVRRLVELTTLARRSGLAVLWVIHFPPAFPGLKPSLKLLDDGRLISEALAAGVRCLLTGHTHERNRYDLGSGRSVEVLCAGTATEHLAWKAPGNWLHVLEVEMQMGQIVGLLRENWMWDERQSSWVLQNVDGP